MHFEVQVFGNAGFVRATYLVPSWGYVLFLKILQVCLPNPLSVKGFSFISDSTEIRLDYVVISFLPWIYNYRYTASNQVTLDFIIPHWFGKFSLRKFS